MKSNYNKMNQILINNNIKISLIFKKIIVILITEKRIKII